MTATATVGRAARAAGEVPVLMYHSVGRDASPCFRRFVTDPGEFAGQMDFLAEAGFEPVTAARLAAARAGRAILPPRPVVLTFDDGFTDFADTIWPVLRGHGFAATLYVPTAYVGATARWLGSCGEGGRPVLSWPDLAALAGEGVEVASHSHTHAQLDRLPAAQAEEEARRSRELLQDQLGREVCGIAYPFGYWDRGVRAAARAAGYGYACAVSELAAAPADDPLALPRLTVNAGLGVAGLSRLLTEPTTRPRRAAAAAKRVVWRELRRSSRRLGGDPTEGGPV